MFSTLTGVFKPRGTEFLVIDFFKNKLQSDLVSFLPKNDLLKNVKLSIDVAC